MNNMLKTCWYYSSTHRSNINISILSNYMYVLIFSFMTVDVLLLCEMTLDSHCMTVVRSFSKFFNVNKIFVNKKKLRQICGEYDLSGSSKVKGNGINWKPIYDLSGSSKVEGHGKNESSYMISSMSVTQLKSVSLMF